MADDFLLKDLLSEDSNTETTPPETSYSLQELLSSQDINSGQNVAYDTESSQTVAFPMGIPDEQANYHLRMEVNGDTEDNFLGHVKVGGKDVVKFLANGLITGAQSSVVESLAASSREYKLNRDKPLEIADSPFYLFEVLTGNADANRFVSLFSEKEKLRRTEEINKYDAAQEIVLNRLRQGIKDQVTQPDPNKKTQQIPFDVGSGFASSAGFLALAYLSKGRGLSTLASTALGGLGAGLLAKSTEFNELVSKYKAKGMTTVEALQSAKDLSTLIGIGEGALEFADLYMFMGYLRGVPWIPRLAARIGSNSVQEGLQTGSSEGIKKLAGVSDSEWQDIMAQMAYSMLIGGFIALPTSAMVTFSEQTGWYGKLLKKGFTPKEIEKISDAVKTNLEAKVKVDLAKTMTDQMTKSTDAILNVDEVQPPTQQGQDIVVSEAMPVKQQLEQILRELEEFVAGKKTVIRNESGDAESSVYEPSSFVTDLYTAWMDALPSMTRKKNGKVVDTGQKIDKATDIKRVKKAIEGKKLTDLEQKRVDELLETRREFYNALEEDAIQQQIEADRVAAEAGISDEDRAGIISEGKEAAISEINEEGLSEADTSFDVEEFQDSTVEKQQTPLQQAISQVEKDIESLGLQGKYNALSKDQEKIASEINALLKDRDARWAANKPTKTVDAKLKEALSKFEVLDAVMESLVVDPEAKVKPSDNITIKTRQLINEVKNSVKYGYKIGAETARKDTTEKFNKQLQALGEKAEASKEMKQLIIDYANQHLSKGDKDTVIGMVKGENVTTLQAINAMQKIDEIADRSKKKSLTKKIKELLRRIDGSKNIAIDYKERIFDLVNNFDLVSRRKETITALQATKEWIETKEASGEDVFLPRYVYDSLRILEQKPYSALSSTDLETVYDDVKFMVELGKTKLKAAKNVYEAERTKKLNELYEAPVNKAQSKSKIADPIKDIGFNDWLKNVWTEVRNQFVLRDRATMPMDHFFYSLGGDVYHRIFKRTLDIKYSNYLTDINLVKDRFDKVLKETKLNKENFRRIGIVATLNQENGAKKLEAGNIPLKLAESIKLTEQEQAMLDYMQGELKTVLPRLQKMMKDVHNAKVGEIANYFPFMTDFDSIQDTEVRERLLDVQRYKVNKKNVSINSTKERTDTEGKAPVKVDAGDVFMKHMDNVIYGINMARDIKMLQEIAKDAKFKAVAGDIGQRITSEWLDVAARKGGRGQNDTAFKLLDNLRKNTSIGALALNPGSIVIQTTALGDASGFIGHYAFTGTTDMANADWRNFVMDNSPKMRNRVGDDQAFREFGNGIRDKALSKLMSPQRYVDSFVASGVWIGSYQKYMNENGLTIDLKNPNQKAIRYADEMVVRTQASASWLDLPTAITRGIGFGDSSSWGKAWTQFQTPLIYRFANLRVHGVKALQDGDYSRFASIFTSQVSTVMAEMGIRHGVKGVQAAMMVALLSAMGIKYDKNKDEKYKRAKIKEFRQKYKKMFHHSISEDQAKQYMLALEFFSTAAGNIPYLSNLMSLAEYNQAPVASIAIVSRNLDNMEQFKRSKSKDKLLKWGTVAVLEAISLFTGAPTPAITKVIKSVY